MARTIGGMNEYEAVVMTYGLAYRHLQETGVQAPTHIDVDTLVSEYRYSHPGKIIGAVSMWLCDSAAWVGAQDERRYKVCKKAYRAVVKGEGVA
jgi:hypothetical protein